MTPADNIAPRHNFTYDGAQLNVYHADKGQGLSRSMCLPKASIK